MSDQEMSGGPLRGLRIIEFAGVGPNPFCAMLLADMGAQVVTIDRITSHGLGIKKEHRFNPTTRSRPSIALDLKKEAGRQAALRLLGQADVLVESHRPGVMERLGLGPDVCWAANPRLVYARATGWGQTGPLAMNVGHDLNYLALSGLLSMIGPAAGPPAIPLNLLGDYAAGGLYLALGILAGLNEARISGRGQIIDAAIIDGLGSLMTHQFGFLGSGNWIAERESNFLDGGAPWYNVYRTADGGYMSVAPIEPRFYRNFLQVLELDPDEMPDQLDRESWPKIRELFSGIFLKRTRDEWCDLFDGIEACVAPVLTIDEAMAHPHQEARPAYVDVDGVIHPAPAPRFSRTPAEIRCGPPTPGEHTSQILAQWGFSEEEISTLKAQEVIGQAFRQDNST